MGESEWEMLTLPRWHDTGHWVAGSLAWPRCDRCGYRVCPLDAIFAGPICACEEGEP